MTTYKWSEMTQEQRDVLVAKCVMDEKKGLITYEQERDLNLMPHYTSNISAAWEVVEKMLERDYWISDLGVDKFFDGTIGYTARYHHTNPDSLGDFVGEVTCTTAPEAICKAALKAVGVDIE
jgi:hypothetical protein